MSGSTSSSTAALARDDSPGIARGVPPEPALADHVWSEEKPLRAALIVESGYYGALATMRSLGRAAIPITVGDRPLLSPTRWSRYAKRRLAFPSLAEPERLVEALLAFGRREPRHVICPSSDDLTYLIGLHAADLRAYFDFYHPGFSTILGVLDKRCLHASCADVGIDTPTTFYPESEEEVRAIARSAKGPLVVKPRTQVFSSYSKGILANAGDLLSSYRALVAHNRYGRMLLDHCPQASRPMIQSYHPVAATSIYSVAGFVDHTYSLSAMRAAVKVLQRPRRLGIGLCFEAAPLDKSLAQRILRLCQHVGYYGVFEVEFIRDNDQILLIDFNPRLYSQVEFEIGRGLPLPLILYAASVGNRLWLQQMMMAADDDRSDIHAYCYRFGLEVVLLFQRLSRSMSKDEARKWHNWCAVHRHGIVDPVFASDDVWPALFDAFGQTISYARHPRGFVRHIMLNQ